MRAATFPKLASVSLLVSLSAAMPWKPAYAYSGSVLHAFTGGTDGSSPIGGLAFDGQGNLYGTTSGETFPLGILHYKKSTVFKITTGGIYSVLHVFGGSGATAYVPTGTLAVAQPAMCTVQHRQAVRTGQAPCSKSRQMERTVRSIPFVAKPTVPMAKLQLAVLFWMHLAISMARRVPGETGTAPCSNYRLKDLARRQFSIAS